MHKQQHLPSSVPDAHLLPISELIAKLHVRADIGLKPKHVKLRQEKVGLNVIARQGRFSPALLLLRRLTDLLVLLLLVAAFVSLALGETADAIIIFIAILLDVTLSYFQVVRSERTLERLRQHVQHMTLTLRDGKLKHIASNQLVPGDIIEFRAGEKIPADARLLECNGLNVSEAALTGESEDIVKTPRTLKKRTPLGNRINMVYLGSTATAGSGRAVVTATGSRSEFGKIAQVLKKERSPISPLRRKLQKSGHLIATGVITAVILIGAASLLSGNSVADSARTAITLIVSAIPEDLTIILTIALAVGMVRILRQQGLVRELDAGETLGSATVICTDKTGTLTRGEMVAVNFDFMQGDTISRSHPIREANQTLALAGLVLASDAHPTRLNKSGYTGSSTEMAALAFVEQMGLSQSKLKQQWRQRDGIMFSPQWKYRATLHDHPTQSSQTIFVTGAPEVLLERSSSALNDKLDPTLLSDTRRFELAEAIDNLAAQGNRLLAVAMRKSLVQENIDHSYIQNLTFLGILVISDPVRPEIASAILSTQSAGVAVKIITGDYLATAQSIALQVGLNVTDDSVISGLAMQDMTDEELLQNIDRINLFARIEPIDKQRIIRILQKKGHVVAMTGDGVNDAVALKSADIGIAMGSGKDIAKDASDLILLDDNFATIVAAIKEGRVLRDNVRKVIGFLLSTNAAEIGIFLVSLIMRLPLPLLPTQILWINLVTDGTSDMALALEPEERNVMQHKPENPKATLIHRLLLSHIFISGAILTTTTMLLYWYLFKYLGHELIYSRTMIFTFLAVSSLLSTWSYRSLWEPILKRGLFQNRWIIVSGAFSLGLHLLAIYQPSFQKFFGTVALDFQDWLIITILSLITVGLIDARKYLLAPRRSRKDLQQTHAQNKPLVQKIA